MTTGTIADMGQVVVLMNSIGARGKSGGDRASLADGGRQTKESLAQLDGLALPSTGEDPGQGEKAPTFSTLLGQIKQSISETQATDEANISPAGEQADATGPATILPFQPRYKESLVFAGAHSAMPDRVGTGIDAKDDKRELPAQQAEAILAGLAKDAPVDGEGLLKADVKLDPEALKSKAPEPSEAPLKSDKKPDLVPPKASDLSPESDIKPNPKASAPIDTKPNSVPVVPSKAALKPDAKPNPAATGQGEGSVKPDTQQNPRDLAPNVAAPKPDVQPSPKAVSKDEAAPTPDIQPRRKAAEQAETAPKAGVKSGHKSSGHNADAAKSDLKSGHSIEADAEDVLKPAVTPDVKPVEFLPQPAASTIATVAGVEGKASAAAASEGKNLPDVTAAPVPSRGTPSLAGPHEDAHGVVTTATAAPAFTMPTARGEAVPAPSVQVATVSIALVRQMQSVASAHSVTSLSREMDLVLKPEGLGTISLRLELDQGNLKVSIAAERATTADDLQRSAGDLAASLADVSPGFDTSNLTITQAPATSTQTGSQSGGDATRNSGNWSGNGNADRQSDSNQSRDDRPSGEKHAQNKAPDPAVSASGSVYI